MDKYEITVEIPPLIAGECDGDCPFFSYGDGCKHGWNIYTIWPEGDDYYYRPNNPECPRYKEPETDSQGCYNCGGPVDIPLEGFQSSDINLLSGGDANFFGFSLSYHLAHVFMLCPECLDTLINQFREVAEDWYGNE